MGYNKKEEAVVASLSLSICKDGTLVTDHQFLDPDVLKSILKKTYPEWTSLDECVNCVRWVSDYLAEVDACINKEYADEDICV